MGNADLPSLPAGIELLTGQPAAPGLLPPNGVRIVRETTP